MAAASGPEDVPRVVAELLRRGEKVPGFGHFVYRGGDPRAILLLDLVRRAAPKSGQLAVADAVFAEVRHKSLPEPNIDFAIATLVRVAGMVRGAGEGDIRGGQDGGWIAHALEAYSGPGPLQSPRGLHRQARGRRALTATRRWRRRSAREQVGVAQVPRVLLDHVQVDHPQRHHLAVAGEGVIQRRVRRRRVGRA